MCGSRVGARLRWGESVVVVVRDFGEGGVAGEDCADGTHGIA